MFLHVTIFRRVKTKIQSFEHNLCKGYIFKQVFVQMKPLTQMWFLQMINNGKKGKL